MAERSIRATFAGQSSQQQQRQQQQYQKHRASPLSRAHDYDEDEDEDDDEDEASEGYGYGLDADQYDFMHAAQRPHVPLGPSGLCLPPQLAFAPLAKLQSQQSSSTTIRSASGAPYVYSPQTYPTPPPPSQGYMHPQLRAPSQSPPGQGPRAHHGATPDQNGSFMVLRTDRRTGNLQVAGASQKTHSGAVHAMRQAPHNPTGGFDEFDANGTEAYNPRAPSAESRCCGKRYTFGSNLRRHVRTAHAEIA
ncbi:hypothetical protein EXIGLDRAFT_708885 [Exidia glandulosa HHB12029]|uniref:Uncharacterized protein n=1 Tax=Exidia glandulosa HHB12029 TaxID=1314781 RepID=A0A165J4X6_EXIGL|nr:hypothetical protein EXIGLDRAFT_708885 [Exidia glandulosa HHB12029]